MSTRALNPQADALVRFAKLLEASEVFVRELIDALDGPSLPFYLEFGSIVFFAASFPHRGKREESETLSGNREETVSGSTRDILLTTASQSFEIATTVSFALRLPGGILRCSTPVNNMGVEGNNCGRYRCTNLAAGAPIVTIRSTRRLPNRA